MKTSKTLLNDLKTQGGFTITPFGETARFTDGYFVARKGFESRTPFFNPADGKEIPLGFFETQLLRYTQLAYENNTLVGGWISDGIFYLDLTERIADRETAIDLASDRDQKAIWDIQAGREIPVPDWKDRFSLALS